MKSPIVDLRSDTVTRPSPAMRARMAAAPVGDDVMREDPTVNELEARSARMLGKEAALFIVSGTMGNQLAAASQTHPGDEIVCERHSHIFRWEVGALAALWGLQTASLEGSRGVLTAGQVSDAVRWMDDIHVPRTALVCLESTHNYGGGKIFPLDEIRRIARVARRAKARMHLDGARMLNACVASGVKPAELARPFDTVTFCLSKGLGAPVGSVLAGDGATIERARRIRKRLGGGWRQAGILAAAGLYALENNVERLAEDHARARRLAEMLASIDGVECRVGEVETNILFFSTGSESRDGELERHLAARGVLVEGGGHFEGIRAVTHLDVDDAGIERCAGEVKRFTRPRARAA